MSGLQRATRHPDRINDPHARAHLLASDALVEPLDAADASWLAEHLGACAHCRATADSFAADAALLHALRDDLPPVPRDLGARVAAGLDTELRASLGRTGRRRIIPLGGATNRQGGTPRRSTALAGLATAALIAVLVLPAVLPVGGPGPEVPVAASLSPVATPIVVDTQPVAWVSRAADGTYVISSAPVDQVCPGADASACGTLDGSATRLGALAVRPSSVLMGRDGSPAVVVGQDAVYAVPVAMASPVTSPEPGSSPGMTTEPAQTPAATGVPATPPAETPSPSVSPSATPAETPTPEPTEPVATASPSPGQETATPETTPSGSPDATEPPSPTPTVEPTPGPTGAPTPTPSPTLPPATPAPTAAQALAIAENVILVGAPPAYSPDGTWVAFSARPADGSHGPDVYAWRVGQAKARALTTDHASVFSGWLDDRILGSTTRVEAADGSIGDEAPGRDADEATVVARSFVLDPVRRLASPIEQSGIWRPVVDPTGRIAVYWTGAFAWDTQAHAWLPADGRLVSAAWKRILRGTGEPAEDGVPAQAAGRHIEDFEVHFDPAGRRLGVWVADPSDPGTGRLALVVVESDGSLGKVVLADATALPGFSLDADRLAWSTPPGRNGQGSLVTVYAWRGEDAGQLYSVPDPGDEPVVVAH